MNKVIINVSYIYGAKKLSFIKMYQLNFVPFYNLEILDSFDDGFEENVVALVNTDSCITRILYNYSSNEFEIYINNIWRHQISDDTIDDIIFKFEKIDWKRTDNTNIETLKELMKMY